MVTSWETIAQEESCAENNAEYDALIQLINKNKLKRVDKRLRVIKNHLEGKKQGEIAEKLGYSRVWVNKLIKQYREKGLEEYGRYKYGGNNRAMSIEEESEILGRFEEDAKKGTLVIANSMQVALVCLNHFRQTKTPTIKKAFDEKRGKDTGRGYIYALLKRHKARKIMPRTSHPKKASDEAIEASKKLTIGTGN